MPEQKFVFPPGPIEDAGDAARGLTLRQFYAAMAAAGIKASGRNLDSGDIADEAFRLADAMLDFEQ